MKKTDLRFIATAWKEGRYYVAQCLNIDVASFGITKKQALRNLEEALELYFEDKPRKLPRVEFPSIEVRVLKYA